LALLSAASVPLARGLESVGRRLGYLTGVEFAEQDGSAESPQMFSF
jgi:hypothetical protein